jgi:N-formylglutamate deformylase
MNYAFTPGSLPLLLSIPHVGTDIPDAIAARLTPAALQRADTDWHLDRLYDFAAGMGASVLAARWSRYVIDLNRPPEDFNLYPGMDTTGLCPVDTFHKEPLYRDGDTPDKAEISERLARYWNPYHGQLRAELARLLALHGRVVLWDAHSIASHVPRFFEGRLPDLNFGTAQGTSCADGLDVAVMARANGQRRFSVAHNGRFKGGYITRHYGQPEARVHAIQLEMCQCLYMNEAAPFGYRPDLAAEVQPMLRELLGAAADWAGREAGLRE